MEQGDRSQRGTGPRQVCWSAPTEGSGQSGCRSAAPRCRAELMSCPGSRPLSPSLTEWKRPSAMPRGRA
jgi:hypothetical protein